MRKVLLLSNTAWYLYNFRLALAKAVRERGYEVTLVTPPGPYVNRLEREGFRCLELAFTGGSKGLLANALQWRRVHQLYEHEKPDLVHNFTIKCVLYGGAAARRLEIPCINAVPGRGYLFTNHRFATRVIRTGVLRLYKYACDGKQTRTIFQNNEDLQYFVDKGVVPVDQTELIRGSGADCDRFRPNGAARRDGPCRVLFASRLLREKGVFDLLEAARRLRESGIDYELLLAGDIYPDNPTSLTKEELERVKKSGVATVLGHVESMPDLLHDADVVVLPSAYGEGTPRILLEAGACGKPLVATNIAGCRGVVRPGENGELVPVGDILALTRALVRLIQDPQLRRCYGKRSRDIVATEFSEHSVIERTLDVYGELLQD